MPSVLALTLGLGALLLSVPALRAIREYLEWRRPWQQGTLFSIKAVVSPLDERPCLVCQWRIERQRLDLGIADQLSDDELGDFEFASEGQRTRVLPGVALYLQAVEGGAWTSQLEGLGPRARAHVEGELGGSPRGTAFHLSQALLLADQRVWRSPRSGALTDTAPELWAAGARRRALWALGSALLLTLGALHAA